MTAIKENIQYAAETIPVLLGIIGHGEALVFKPSDHPLGFPESWIGSSEGEFVKSQGRCYWTGRFDVPPLVSALQSYGLKARMGNVGEILGSREPTGLSSFAADDYGAASDEPMIDVHRESLSRPYYSLAIDVKADFQKDMQAALKQAIASHQAEIVQRIVTPAADSVLKGKEYSESLAQIRYTGFGLLDLVKRYGDPKDVAEIIRLVVANIQTGPRIEGATASASTRPREVDQSAGSPNWGH